MIIIRKSNERGHAQHGWLEARHTFSFAGYYDPKHTGFRDLLVINEDRVQPGEGFGKHPHRDMEIITYIIEGELEHKDSMGNGSVIRPGDIQRMSAGTGVLHSEFNHSKQNLVHLLQIWITPAREGIQPSYEEKKILPEEKRNRLKLIVSPKGEDGSVRINQDAKLYSSLLDPGKEVNHELASGRHGWLQIARGSVDLNGVQLEEGDGAAISEEHSLKLRATKPAELLLFDLP
ncbi:MAG TPA: pirin family protein [Bdellovibrionota bacterium]|nr:pirin family protein [Bdellovibrionota bacterium]